MFFLKSLKVKGRKETKIFSPLFRLKSLKAKGRKKKQKSPCLCFTVLQLLLHRTAAANTGSFFKVLSIYYINMYYTRKSIYYVQTQFGIILVFTIRSYSSPSTSSAPAYLYVITHKYACNHQTNIPAYHRQKNIPAYHSQTQDHPELPPCVAAPLMHSEHRYKMRNIKNENCTNMKVCKIEVSFNRVSQLWLFYKHYTNIFFSPS